MKKIVYGIGLAPNEGPFKGKTPRERILNYANGLKREKDKDSVSFIELVNFIYTKLSLEAQYAFHGMDTAVRDTFINAYTYNGRDKRARKELKKILNIF